MIKQKIRELAADRRGFAAVAALFGALAGTVNGFIGSGGGILLIYGMELLLGEEQDTKDRFTTAVVSILPMSAISAYIYYRNSGASVADAAPYLSAALFGGVFGAWLMTVITPKILKTVFAVLMVWAGYRAFFGS